jgi:hypothetical protein
MIRSVSLISLVLFPCFAHGFLSSLFSSKSVSPSTRVTGGSGVPDLPNILGNNRGIASDTLDKYSKDIFLCDGINIPINKVNDNFCDCLDGTDEPGTSACHTGIFTCQNVGFQMIKIPSSRVDDGICDCCDGSDESNPSLCANDCDAIAAQERKSLEIFYQNYLIGSKIKKEKRNEMETKIQNSFDSVEALLPQLAEVKENLEQAQQNLVKELVLEKEEMNELTRQLSQQLSSFLKLDEMNEEKMAPLFSVIFSVLDVIEEDIFELLESKQSPVAARSSENERTPTDFGDDVGHHDDLDLDHDLGHEDDADAYEDEYHPPQQEDEEETIVSLDNPPTPTETADDPLHYDADTCPLLKYSSDDRLHLLCLFYSKESNPLTSLQEFLIQFILHRKPLKELQLLLGYETISGTFHGAKDFFTRIMSTTLPPEPGHESDGIGSHYCPLEFENHPKLCLVADQLNSILTSNDVTQYLRPEVKQLREEIEQLNHQQNDLNRLKSEHEKLINESREYQADLYDLLASKGECYDRVDGAFTYTVCLGTKVTQKENGRGNGGVNLGTFSNPTASIVQEEGSDGVTGRTIPIYKLLYSNGQHCHAFGARKAEVSITCGEKNQLLDATEPSTCSYSFKFESPIACSESYAKAYGFQI